MNKKFATILTTSTALLVASSSLAFASGTSNCQVIYGGGEVCPPEVKFTIDKKVMSPNKGGSYVDNLSANDAKYMASQEVPFQIVVSNTGKKDIKLTITDILPSYIDFVSGGTYDSNGKQVKNTIELKAGETKTLNIVGKVTTEDKMPANQAVVCVTNIVKATDENAASAEDNAQFCIEKGVPQAKVYPAVPTKNIPNTGPEAFALAILPPLGAAGLYLRRKASL